MTKNNFKAQVYTSPACKTIEVKARKVLCESNPYGESGGAGKSTRVDEEGDF